jgi:hypothetical protein
MKGIPPDAADRVGEQVDTHSAAGRMVLNMVVVAVALGEPPELR